MTLLRQPALLVSMIALGVISLAGCSGAGGPVAAPTPDGGRSGAELASGITGMTCLP